MPANGFSDKTKSTGWNTVRMASAFHELMLGLGYIHQAVQAAWRHQSKPIRAPGKESV
jgi:hypothetical protein